MGLAPSRKILNIFKVWTSKSSAAPMCIPALEHRAQPAVLRRRGFGSFDEPKGSTVRPGSRGDPFLDADHGVKGLDRYAAAKPPLTPWSASKSCRPRDPGLALGRKYQRPVGTCSLRRLSDLPFASSSRGVDFALPLMPDPGGPQLKQRGDERIGGDHR